MAEMNPIKVVSVALVFALSFLTSIHTGQGNRAGSGIAVGGIPGAALAEQGLPDTGDKTLSPYFFVKSEDSDVDRLPMKSTSAEVEIAGVIANVKVVQTYRNEGKRPIEAIYVFPASTRAAVSAMKMTIGERTVTAVIRKREEARRDYEQAKSQGKSASLLEQQRPNVFQMNVANIMPGDEIRTELTYNELLSPTEGAYEFVYPTVVGPRYSNQPAAGAPASEKWVQNPYLHEKEPPTYSFNITARLNAGLPIREITCPSHDTAIRYEGQTRASVDLGANEKFGGNRDFVLKYRLSGEHIDSGLLLYRGKDENFFLLTVQPPKRVVEAAIPAREYIFIVDVSGSMHGFPLEISKRLLTDLIGGLKPTDCFNVMLFSGDSTVMAERSVPASADNIRRAVEMIGRRQGGGGTELLPALKKALSLPRKEGVSRSLVIATDGFVTVEEEAFDLIRSHIGDANFFPFGIGTSVNRMLIEGMARAGAGEPFVITRPDEAPAGAEKFRRYIQSPLLTNVKADFGAFGVYDVEPAGIPDVLAERPVVIFGKWRGEPSGKITVKGSTGAGEFGKTVDVAGSRPEESNSVLKYLWARARITSLTDRNQLRSDAGRIGQITELGLKYGLLTSYTSFVAIDTLVRNQSGSDTVTQPLPLPQGVSDLAVGAPSPGLRMYKSMAAPRGAGRGEMSSRESAGSGRPQASPAREEKEKAPGKSDLRIAVRKVEVRGSLAETDVRSVVDSRAQEFLNCPEWSAGKHKPGFETIVIEWVVDRSGKVGNVRIVSSSKRLSAHLERCMIKIVKNWIFPSGGNKGTVVRVIVEY